MTETITNAKKQKTELEIFLSLAQHLDSVTEQDVIDMGENEELEYLALERLLQRRIKQYKIKNKLN